MEKGTVQKISYPGLSWKLGNTDLSEICYSKSFFVAEKDNDFYFELYPRKEGFTCLSLWQVRGSALKALHFVITLRYKDKCESFIYQSNNLKNTRKSRKVDNLRGLYELKTIKSSGLLEVNCYLLNVEIFDKNGDETESDDDEYYDGHSDVEQDAEESDDEQDEEQSDDEEDEEENHDEKEERSRSLKQEYVRLKVKGSDTTRSRGGTAFIENLKSAFLDEEDSDLILKVGEQEYPVHKVIIKARSSVFQAMLRHDMTEKNLGVVDIADGDPHIFRDFLLYLYTGKLDNISKENVFELYYMSDKYNVTQLKLDCVDYIVYNLSTDIVCDVISLATKHCERELLEHAIKLFTQNANDIFVTLKWQEFLKENPVQANELIIKAFKNVSSK